MIVKVAGKFLTSRTFEKHSTLLSKIISSFLKMKEVLELEEAQTVSASTGAFSVPLGSQQSRTI